MKHPEYEQHPLAMALPGGMDEQEFSAFCDDVCGRGVVLPIVLYEGKILDGWKRYIAAKRTGTRATYETYEGKDPFGHLLSLNIHRRRLSSLQRAMVGAHMHQQMNVTQREVCKRLGISNEALNLALKALGTNNAKLLARINDSDFTRAELREELEHLGTIAPQAASTAVSNVFQLAERLLATPAPDDSPDTTGIGLTADQRSKRKPSKTAAQLLQEQYEALMHEDKLTFLQMIWPTAEPLLTEANLVKQVARRKRA